MDYSMLSAYGLVADLYSRQGSRDIDRLSDYMLADIGYKRVAGRAIKDEDRLEERVAQRQSWSWPAFLGGSWFTPRITQHSATLG